MERDTGGAKALIAMCRSEVVRLTRFLSLAVRVEPALLRRARYTLTPDLDSGVESDLWFSPLVGSRSSNAIVLDRDVADVLRNELAENPEDLKAAGGLVEKAHHQESVALRLEEKIILLALEGGPEATAVIDRELRPALAALVSDRQRGLEVARWADRAVRGFPSLARQAEAVSWLAWGSAARLGPQARPRQELEEIPAPLSADWIWPGNSTSSSVDIGVRIYSNALKFVAPESEQSATLKLPTPDLLPVRVEWRIKGAPDHRAVTVEEGLVVPLPTGYKNLKIGTATGTTYLLSTAREDRPTGEPRRHSELLIYISVAAKDGGAELEKFSNDLVKLVHQFSARPARCIGSFQSKMVPGSQLDGKLAEALRSCNAFVAIVTHDYSRSIWCGRELTAFQLRVQKGTLELPQTGPLPFFPIMWQREDYSFLPPTIANLSPRDANGTPKYYGHETSDGLGYYAKLTKEKDKYFQSLEKLANDIARFVRDYPLPSEVEIPPIKDLESAFYVTDGPVGDSSVRLDWALNMIQTLALKFHTGKLEPTGLSREQREEFYGLLPQKEKNDFNHVRAQCEYIFAGTVTYFLQGASDPFHDPDDVKIAELHKRIEEAQHGDGYGSYLLTESLKLIEGFASTPEREMIHKLLGMDLKDAIKMLEAWRAEGPKAKLEEILERLKQVEFSDVAKHYLNHFNRWFKSFPSTLQSKEDFPTYIERLIGLWLNYSERAERGAGKASKDLELYLSKDSIRQFESRFPKVQLKVGEQFNPSSKVASYQPTEPEFRTSIMLSDYRTVARDLGKIIVAALRKEHNRRKPPSKVFTDTDDPPDGWRPSFG